MIQSKDAGFGQRRKDAPFHWWEKEGGRKRERGKKGEREREEGEKNQMQSN